MRGSSPGPHSLEPLPAGQPGSPGQWSKPKGCLARSHRRAAKYSGTRSTWPAAAVMAGTRQTDDRVGIP